MKQFSFPLDQVLAWRRVQQKLEEVKVQRAQAELHSVDARHAALARELGATVVLSQAGGITGSELSAIDRYRKHLASEQKRAAAARSEIAKRAAALTEVLTAKRRDAMLLEKVRRRRWNEWNRELAHEVEMQAAEAALRKWTQVQ